MCWRKITGNRKTYGLCLVGCVRWDIPPDMATELRAVLEKLESEWRSVVDAVGGDRNIQKRTRGVGVASPDLVKDSGLVGPVARASGVDIDCRRDHPYAAYDRLSFDVIVDEGGDVWSRLKVRMSSVRIDPDHPAMPKRCQWGCGCESAMSLVGRMGISSVEAPRRGAHHFLITGEANRPRRRFVRRPTRTSRAFPR